MAVTLVTWRERAAVHAARASGGTDQGFLSGSIQIGVRRASNGFQFAVDPANEIAAFDVPDEQKRGCSQSALPLGRLVAAEKISTRRLCARPARVDLISD
jgi:hypothetical protein